MEEIETKETKNKKTAREKKRRKKKVSWPPVGDVADNTERAKEITPLQINRVKPSTKENNRQRDAQKSSKQKSTHAAAAVCGTSS